MRVGVQRYLHLRVTQTLTDNLHWQAFGQQDRGVGVAKAMQGEWPGTRRLSLGD
jgi:hypothetical protein